MSSSHAVVSAALGMPDAAKYAAPRMQRAADPLRCERVPLSRVYKVETRAFGSSMATGRSQLPKPKRAPRYYGGSPPSRSPSKPPRSYQIQAQHGRVNADAPYLSVAVEPIATLELYMQEGGAARNIKLLEGVRSSLTAHARQVADLGLQVRGVGDPAREGSSAKRHAELEELVSAGSSATSRSGWVTIALFDGWMSSLNSLAPSARGFEPARVDGYCLCFGLVDILGVAAGQTLGNSAATCVARQKSGASLRVVLAEVPGYCYEALVHTRRREAVRKVRVWPEGGDGRARVAAMFVESTDAKVAARLGNDPVRWQEDIGKHWAGAIYPKAGKAGEGGRPLLPAPVRLDELRAAHRERGWEAELLESSVLADGETTLKHFLGV